MLEHLRFEKEGVSPESQSVRATLRKLCCFFFELNPSPKKKVKQKLNIKERINRRPIKIQFGLCGLAGALWKEEEGMPTNHIFSL